MGFWKRTQGEIRKMNNGVTWKGLLPILGGMIAVALSVGVPLWMSQSGAIAKKADKAEVGKMAASVQVKSIKERLDRIVGRQKDTTRAVQRMAVKVGKLSTKQKATKAQLARIILKLDKLLDRRHRRR